MAIAPADMKVLSDMTPMAIQAVADAVERQIDEHAHLSGKCQDELVLAKSLVPMLANHPSEESLLAIRVELCGRYTAAGWRVVNIAIRATHGRNHALTLYVSYNFAE